MNQVIYDITLRSIRAAVNHLRLMDLTELAADAQTCGTPEDRALIDGVARALEMLPPEH